MLAGMVSDLPLRSPSTNESILTGEQARHTF
jgi:hypothetical protein